MPLQQVSRSGTCSRTHRSLQPGWLVSACLWVYSCGSRSLSRVSIGSLFVSEASMVGSEAGLPVTPALPFKVLWFLGQPWPSGSICSYSRICLFKTAWSTSPQNFYRI